MEYEEDLRQFREKVLETPLDERRKKGITWYPVEITNEKMGLGDHLMVDVERNTDTDKRHLFQVGSVAALFSNRDGGKKAPPTATAVISKIKDNTIQLAFQGDELPDWVYEDQGKLGLDLYFDERSYREMNKALDRVIEAENNRLADLREILLGKGTPGFHKGELGKGYPNLNESQNEAVEKVSQAHDVAIIHGPPGTGKTTTMVQAIRHTLRTEKQVLVCAPSNSAVDLLTERLGEVGVDVVRIGHPARISDELQKHTVDYKVSKHPGYQELKRYKKEAEQMRTQALKFKRKFGYEERQQRKELLRESRKLKKQVFALEDYILKDTIDKAQVVCATLVGAAGKLLAKKKFHTLFIDEAAQALEPACWIPLAKTHRVIFAGDHCQLPPTIKSFPAARKGLATTLFEKCIERQEVDVLLQTQYRMLNEIMEFSSRKFYDGMLIAHESVAHDYLCQRDMEPMMTLPVEFIDTAGIGYEEKYNQESKSTSNPEEANLLLKRLTQLAEALDRQGMPPPSIGIIAPYRDQVLYLRRNILNHPDLEPLLPHITIDTVDAFQGREREIICISLVRSNDKNEIGFLADIRRMNVAMTRARQKLIMIGDSATLGNNEFYRDLLEYVESVEGYRSAWEFVSM